MEVGEYVRTKYGAIYKVKNIIDFKKENSKPYRGGSSGNLVIITNNPKEDVVWKNYTEEIVKHSKNIIDLIEVGDYVNGQEVVTVYGYDEDGNDRDDKGIIEVDDDFAYGVYLEDIKIYSILTKEQYEANCYKVKE